MITIPVTPFTDYDNIRMPKCPPWFTVEDWVRLLTEDMEPARRWLRNPLECPFQKGEIVSLGANITSPSDLTQTFHVTGAWFSTYGSGWLIHMAYGDKPSEPIEFEGRLIPTEEHRTVRADRLHRIRQKP